MNKIRNIVNKYDNIAVSIVFLIFMLKSFDVYTVLCDELLNFSTINQMINGYEIYKDINVLTTPMFFYMIKFILKIIGTNIFTFRVCNVIINTLIYLIIYNICKKISKEKVCSFIYTMILYMIFDLSRCMCNYNTLALLFFLIGILLNLDEKNQKNYLLHGILLFFIFMCKQNIGIYYIIGAILNIIFNNHCNREKILNLVKTILVSLFLFAIYCIYLYMNHNLYNFVNYCFLGLTDFGKNNLYVDNNYVLISVFFVFVWITISIINSLKVKNDSLNVIKYYSLPMLMIGYPIFNNFHVVISVYGVLIYFVLFINEIIIKEIINLRIKKIIMYVLIITNIITSFFYFYKSIYRMNNKEYISNIFYGAIFIDDENVSDTIDMKKIENVSNYIKNNEKQTIVLSPKSKLYALVLGYCNGIFDLPFYGNMGKEGEEGLIRKLSELRNTDILIVKNKSEMMWQESEKAREYIKDNFNLVGEIEEFLIYETE